MHDNADYVTPRVINRRVEGVPAGAVYVGRPTKWGNPFVVGRDAPQGRCVELYREWLPKQLDLVLALRELRGLDLVCWCAPKPCHADVLLELANADL